MKPYGIALFILLTSCLPIQRKDARHRGSTTKTVDAATDQVLPEISAVDASQLKIQKIKLSETNIEGHAALRIAVEINERAEYVQFYICTLGEPQSCQPKKNSPDISYLDWLDYPVPPSGEIQVSVQACVEEEHALDPLFNCGPWKESAPYLQKENNDPEREKQLVEDYERQKQIVKLCDGVLQDLRDYQENPEEGDEATDTVVANQVGMGKIVCIKAMQRGEAKEVAKTVGEEGEQNDKQNIGATTILAFGVLGIAALVLAGVSVKSFMEAAQVAKYHKTIAELPTQSVEPVLQPAPPEVSRQPIEQAEAAVQRIQGERQLIQRPENLPRLEAQYKQAATTALRQFLQAAPTLQHKEPMEWTFEHMHTEYTTRMNAINRLKEEKFRLETEAVRLESPKWHLSYWFVPRGETQEETAQRNEKRGEIYGTMRKTADEISRLQPQLDELGKAYEAFEILGMQAEGAQATTLRDAHLQLPEETRRQAAAELERLGREIVTAQQGLQLRRQEYDADVLQRQQTIQDNTARFTEEQRVYDAEMAKRASVEDIRTKFGGQVPEARTLNIRGAISTAGTFGSLILLSALIAHAASTQGARLVGESKTAVLKKKLNKRYETFLRLAP
ncbi:MAG: hypothetical protein HYW48_06630 [Deltaproteobacteria bacterium]|nr:hypothetical protein [Deltaproteobacteria bacterium]